MVGTEGSKRRVIRREAVVARVEWGVKAVVLLRTQQEAAAPARHLRFLVLRLPTRSAVGVGMLLLARVAQVAPMVEVMGPRTMWTIRQLAQLIVVAEVEAAAVRVVPIQTAKQAAPAS